jgi:hypothetical protein
MRHKSRFSLLAIRCSLFAFGSSLSFQPSAVSYQLRQEPAPFE